MLTGSYSARDAVDESYFEAQAKGQVDIKQINYIPLTVSLRSPETVQRTIPIAQFHSSNIWDE